MLYDGYTTETDPFYNSDIDYSLSIKNLQYANNAEYIKQRMLGTNCWSFFNSEASARECTSYLLLCVPFLTLEHIVSLGLYSNTNAARVFINRLEKNKLATFRSSRAGQLSKEKLVYLCNDIYNATYNKLPSAYIDKRHILSTPRNPATGSFAHDTSVINLLCLFLADRRFNFFDFWWRAPLDIYSSFDKSINEYKDNSSINSNPDSFIPDASMKSLENGCITFIEQDMSTERPVQLKVKFNSYIDYMNRQSLDELNRHSILVSIDTKYTSNLTHAPASNSKVYFERTQKELYALQTLSASYHTTSLDELLTIIEQQTDNNLDSTVANRLSKLKLLIRKSRGSVDTDKKLNTLDDLISFINGIKKKLIDERNASLAMERTRILSSRINTFRKLASELKDLQHLFIHGLSLYTIDSHDYNSLPYLMIQQYKTYQALMELVMDRHIRFRFNYTYEPYTIHQCNDKNFVFKNAIHYQTTQRDILITFENISADISAIYRIQNYLTQVESEESHIFYYLLVESEREALEFYNNYISNLEISDNIHIAFLQYTGVELENDAEPIPLLFTTIGGNVEYY